MLSNMRNVCALSALVLSICITFSYGGSISKRDVGDDIQDQLPQGNVCVTDDGCSVFEYCDHEGLNFHCEIRGWIIAVIVIVILAILLSIIVSCCCCTTCWCYQKIRG
ncbi:hypothetical protein TCAL_05494 [Tigriopus californicus]|uniref:Uncharacterized protein n=1 Tax=Tigriopus californicus TaxID=6832 RepID=A0A553NNZ8_TIGCA|nr:hypothetical protein TCAL_05494 [Tigriopus californicus]|eukprot:TCALIF_05494-PA protein Name:"Protein of unknown function" AED:0.00 eAED:0.00 QI:213/1/1/1/1/1/2/127/107